MDYANGRMAYRAYEQANNDQGCEVDPWDVLDDRDKQMWEAMYGILVKDISDTERQYPDKE